MVSCPQAFAIIGKCGVQVPIWQKSGHLTITPALIAKVWTGLVVMSPQTDHIGRCGGQVCLAVGYTASVVVRYLQPLAIQCHSEVSKVLVPL